MSRRVKSIAITTPGRDFGKRFELREMPADQGERWATRAILALANAGAKLPEGTLDGGMAGLELTWRNVVVTGVQALQGLKYHEVEPLLDEMKHFIKYQPPLVPGTPSPPVQQIFPGEDSQIEEVSTWYTLRYELFQLHVDFSLLAAPSTTDISPESAPSI